VLYKQLTKPLLLDKDSLNKKNSNAMLSVSFCLPKKNKLLNKKDFSWVFDKAVYKASSRQFLILARESQSDQSRLGLVIAKKHIKLAVNRNRIKRLIRESFRHNQHQLLKIDAIVLSRNGLADLDNLAIYELLHQLWKKIQSKAST
jgi:ribonuclease P protein component